MRAIVGLSAVVGLGEKLLSLTPAPAIQRDKVASHVLLPFALKGLVPDVPPVRPSGLTYAVPSA